MRLSADRLKRLSQNIKKFRTSRRLTQEQISERIGVSTIHYNQIELGNKAPSLEALINISEVLNVSTDALIYGPSDQSDISDVMRLFENVGKENTEKLKKMLYYVADEFLIT